MNTVLLFLSFIHLFVELIMPVCVCCLRDAVHGFPLGSERSDQADPYSADGHGPDEGARERPGDAAGPAVQLGALVRQHP